MTTTKTSDAARNYWENRLSKKWGLHVVGHISYGRPYNQWLYRVRRRVFLRQLRKLPIQLSQATVLDIGSGTGFWLKIWKSFGVRTVVGSDFTHVAVQHLRQENPEMKILELDITDEKAVFELGQRFDLISAFDVLFHIIEEERFAAAIANVTRLLRPGGYFLFSDCLLHGCSRHATHEVDRTMTDFTNELQRNGLEICSRVPVFVLMNSPIDLAAEFPQFVWRLTMLPVRLLPWLGHFYGALLYPIEILLTRLLRESPTTEMAVCRGKSSASFPKTS